MFQVLLTSYYICNAASALTLADYATVARCVMAYQSIKAHFLSEEELAHLRDDPLGYSGEHGRIAYLRFAAWEDDNPQLVAELKADARAILNAGRN